LPLNHCAAASTPRRGSAPSLAMSCRARRGSRSARGAGCWRSSTPAVASCWCAGRSIWRCS
jgi:hypothetical protein